MVMERYQHYIDIAGRFKSINKLTRLFDFYYRIKLKRIYRFGNYNPILDRLLRILIEDGISKIEDSDYYFGSYKKITFNSGLMLNTDLTVLMEFSDGRLSTPSGTPLHKWWNSHVSWKTLYQMKELIENEKANSNTIEAQENAEHA